MLISWALCASLLPALALASAPGNCSAQHFSSVLDSLKCYNDYKSHIRCSWRESVRTHSQAPLSLFHLDVEDYSESECEPYAPPVPLPEGQLEVRCQYNTTFFAIGNVDHYFFKTRHSPGFSRNLSAAQLVRVRPPRSLSQRATEGGGRELRWKASYPPNLPLYPTLSYQVNYRRLGQEWTVVEVSGEELVIESDSLMPGFLYEARVRGRGGKGLWSDWSSLVEWKTEEGPYNLQCEFDGEATVSCSWELKTDLAQFVTYNLSYRTDANAPAQWCCFDTPVSVDTSVSVLRFSCSFSASQPEQLLVELTPSYNKRAFWSPKHIHPNPPAPVKVQEQGEDWVLSWTPTNSRKLPISFLVRYWISETPKEMIYHNVSQGGWSQHFHTSSLLPSTGYSAQVRALLTPGDHLYDGSPSDWTEPVHWSTHPAPWSLSTILFHVSGLCAAVLFLLLTFPACRRGVKLWEKSIPSPFKSKMLEEMRKKSTDSRLASEKEVERALVSEIEVLESVQMVAYSPHASGDSSQQLWSTTTYQQVSGQGTSVAANPRRLSGERHAGDVSCMGSSGLDILCSHGLHPKSEDAVSGPGLQGSTSRSYVPTFQEMPLQCGTEYVVPPAKISLARDVSPKWEPEVHGMCNCPLLGPPESEIELPSAPEPLDMDPYPYMPIPFNIHSDMIQKNLDRCLLPDPGTAKRGTAPHSVPPGGCRSKDLADNRVGWLEDIEEDYNYVKLSHVILKQNSSPTAGHGEKELSICSSPAEGSTEQLG